jgi:hypothetical protein
MHRGFIAQTGEGLERVFAAAETARSLDDNDAGCHRIPVNHISPPSTLKRRRDWQVRSKRPKIPAKSEVTEGPVWVQRSNAVVARVGFQPNVAVRPRPLDGGLVSTDQIRATRLEAGGWRDHLLLAAGALTARTST